jgi:hypothetical protein
MIILYNKSNNSLEKVKNTEALDNLYYLKHDLPTQSQIDEYVKKNNNDISNFLKNKGLKNIVINLSSLTDHFPLFSPYDENLYLVSKELVFKYVMYDDYRFPTQDFLTKLIQKQQKIGTENRSQTDDVIEKRKYKKMNLMINFLTIFDLDIMQKNYEKVFYANNPRGNVDEKNLSICKRPSYMTHFQHLKPYYTIDDLRNIALNMGRDISDYDKLCSVVRENDISADTLLEHQRHIIKNDKVGLIQYYTLQGSYVMNEYLRNNVSYNTKNLYLEKLIKLMWELVNESPAFDKSYTVYRFVFTDSHISHLQIGDIYIEPSFISTTRDPFYRVDLHKFGFILVKIKIPKMQKGMALCVETLSHFMDEQEIVLPPLSMLRLDKRDDKCDYFHTNKKCTSLITSRYEFTLIGKKDISFIDKPLVKYVKTIDFLKLPEYVEKDKTIDGRIDHFFNNSLNEQNQFIAIVGKSKFVIIAEFYNSLGIIDKFYAVSTENGFSFYTIYENYIIFMIEIGSHPKTKRPYMHVNYNIKYSTVNKNKYFSDNEFILFLSSIAFYFKIDSVTLWADFKSCDLFAFQHNKKFAPDRSYEESEGNIPYNFVKNFQSTIDDVPKIQRSYETKFDNDNDYIENINFSKLIGGGTYCVDFYKYFTKSKTKYDSISSLELQPNFTYKQLDIMLVVSPFDILNKNDPDDIYQIYDKAYLQSIPDIEYDNLADFYIYLIEHKCYLVNTFVEKLNRLFNKNVSPFVLHSYNLDPYAYLYNHELIGYYPDDDSYHSETNIKTNKNKKSIVDVLRYRTRVPE